MNRHWLSLFGGILCGAAFLAGCATSALVDIWSDSAFQPPALNKLLVISVSRNAVQRRIWEDGFSAEFTKHAMEATPSYRLYEEAVPDSAQVAHEVSTRGFDGILVIRWLPPETKAEHLAGYVTTEEDLRYDRHADRFVRYYREVEHAGRIDSQKVDIRTIDLWATRNDGELIWSGTSRTLESNSAGIARPEIVELVLSDLTGRGMIASRQK